MTKITISRNSIEFDGHAKKASVCHALSAISQMVANYVIRQNWGEVDISEDAYVRIHNIQENHLESDLFKALIDMVMDLQVQYPEHVTVNFV